LKITHNWFDRLHCRKQSAVFTLILVLTRGVETLLERSYTFCNSFCKVFIPVSNHTKIVKKSIKKLGVIVENKVARFY